MDSKAYLTEALAEYHKYRRMCERAVAQVSDEDFFASVSPESTSIAVILKHLAGNHRSRWTDFLTTDGEKPDRHRDGEFLVDGETRASIWEQWEEAWEITFKALEALGPGDLERSITIRGQAHSVLEAIQRNLTHLAYHVGQVVFLARVQAGSAWRTLSIPVGGSEAFNRRVWEGPKEA